MCDTTIFFFKFADFPINLHCCCLFPVHVLNPWWIFSIYFQLCWLCDNLTLSYFVKCLHVVNEAQIYLFLYFQNSFNHSSRMWIAFFVPFPFKQFLCYFWFDFVSGIMMILKSILVIWLIKEFILLNLHSVVHGFFRQCYKYGFGDVWWNLTCAIDFVE